MDKIVGVVAKAQSADIFSIEYIKHLVLFFDSLVICTIDGRHNLMISENEDKYEINQLIYLLEEQGFLLWGGNPNGLPDDRVQEFQTSLEQDPEFRELMYFYLKKGVELDQKLGVKHGFLAHPTGPYDPMWHQLVRGTALRLYKFEYTDAVPITFNDPLLDNPPSFAQYDDIVRLVIRNLPRPGPLTSLEEIIEFRKDEEAKSSMVNLCLWAKEIVRNQMTVHEAEQKLNYLINEYRNYMQLHIRQIYPGFLETLIVGSASFIEDLVKVNAGAIAKRLFTAKHRKTKLLLAEKEAPGREISFVVRAQDKFV